MKFAIPNLIPTWPLAAGALAAGIAMGAYGDHKVMQSRIDKIELAHAQERAEREARRSRDEAAARQRESFMAARMGEIEQGKNDEIEKVRNALAAANSRLQDRPSRPAAGTGGVPAPRAACPGATGAELSRQDGAFLVGEAARADTLRAALTACYKAYDEVERKAPPPKP